MAFLFLAASPSTLLICVPAPVPLLKQSTSWVSSIHLPFLVQLPAPGEWFLWGAQQAFLLSGFRTSVLDRGKHQQGIGIREEGKGDAFIPMETSLLCHVWAEAELLYRGSQFL